MKRLILAVALLLSTSPLLHATGPGLHGDGVVDVSLDLTPTLGGDLDVNGNNITSATGLDIAIGAAAGNDFTVDTNKLVVEGDTGNTGIGTTSPAQLLDLVSSGNSILRIDGAAASTNGIIFARGGTESGRMSFSSSADLIFSMGSGAAEKVRVTAAGNVGIGEPSPSSLLTVNGPIELNNANIPPVGPGMYHGVNFLQFRGGATGYSFNDTANFVSNLTILDGGNIGVGTIAPDGNLHVMSGSAGTVVANSAADELTVEMSADGGINLLAPDANNSHLYFGSVSDTQGAFLRWNHNASLFKLGTAKTGAATTLMYGNGNEGLRIDSAGNVGIGTSLPAYKLDIKDGDVHFDLTAGANNAAIGIDALRGNGASIEFRRDAVDDDEIRFYTLNTGVSGGLRMTLDKDGKLGLGTAIPSTTLDVNGTFQVVGSVGTISVDSNGNRISMSRAGTNLIGSSNASGNLSFITGGVDNRMFITSGGNIGIGTTNPAAELQITGTTTPSLYIQSTTASDGGSIILEDTDGAGCTEITVLNGVISGAIVTCP